jgi:hypothetical protein
MMKIRDNKQFRATQKKMISTVVQWLKKHGGLPLTNGFMNKYVIITPKYGHLSVLSVNSDYRPGTINIYCRFMTPGTLGTERSAVVRMTDMANATLYSTGINMYSGKWNWHNVSDVEEFLNALEKVIE